MMKIEVTTLTPQIAVAIKRTAVTMDDIPEIIGEICPKLLAYIGEQGKEITGAPYLAYMNANEDYSKFDIEWGFPIAEPISVSGEMYMSKTYEGKAITAIHKGSYSTMDETYTLIMDYASANELESTGVTYDYYFNDPDETPESELLTQVVFPIR